MWIILFGTMVAMWMLLSWLESLPVLCDDSAFKKKWPEISDDEFLERCPPRTNRETALKVRRIVAEQLGFPYEHIYPEQNFVDDLGCG